MAKFSLKKLNIKAAAVNAVATGAGAIAGAYVNTIPQIGGLSPMYRGIGKIVVGAFLPQILGGGKNAMINGIGNGMIATGSLEAASDFLGESTKVAVSGLPTLNGTELPTLGEVSTMEMAARYGN